MLSIKRILVPVDFSEGSRCALRKAVMMAETFDAQIDVLHVWEPSPYVSPSQLVWMSGESCVFSDRMHAEFEQRVRQLVSEEAPEHEARINVIVRAGYTSHDILETLRDEHYDLVVMGTHGRTGLSHLILGSVAERIVRMAPCPVMTIRVTTKKERHQAKQRQTKNERETKNERQTTNDLNVDLETPTYL